MTDETGNRRVLVVVHGARLDVGLAGQIAADGAVGAALVVGTATPHANPSDWLEGTGVGGADEAYANVGASVAALGGVGIPAAGRAGDSDPLHAIEQSYDAWGPSEIFLVTADAASPQILETLWRARRRCPAPVTHLAEGGPPPERPG